MFSFYTYILYTRETAACGGISLALQEIAAGGGAFGNKNIGGGNKKMKKKSVLFRRAKWF